MSTEPMMYVGQRVIDERDAISPQTWWHRLRCWLAWRLVRGLPRYHLTIRSGVYP